MELANTHVDAVVRDYIRRYLETNNAASTLSEELTRIGIGLLPVVDHLGFRTLDIQERAPEFEALGYNYDDNIGVIERDSWWAKVYRKPGFPAVYLEQAFLDQRGASSPIHAWVERFSDGQLHHIAVNVDRIDDAVEHMSRIGIRFTGEIIGEPESGFRQVYAEPEIVEGEEFTTFEVVERRWGYSGFLSPQVPAM